MFDVVICLLKTIKDTLAVLEIKYQRYYITGCSHISLYNLCFQIFVNKLHDVVINSSVRGIMFLWSKIGSYILYFSPCEEYYCHIITKITKAAQICFKAHSHISICISLYSIWIFPTVIKDQVSLAAKTSWRSYRLYDRSGRIHTFCASPFL